MKKRAIIIGAGPAGLSAAYELLKKTDIIPIIYECENHVGGISRTFDYNGNKMDMGGHRFFSKSDRIMNWWLEIFPLQGALSADDIVLKRELPLSNAQNAPDPEKDDIVMLFRNRVSRIFFLQNFFDYPVSLNMQTLLNLGFFKTVKIGFSYIKTVLLPKRKEISLEDFIINRFGKELYLTFFKDYTEKVWGIECASIPADWGAQRIKGISISRILKDKISSVFKRNDKSIYQKNKETSLIEQFLYPKFGPGHLWNEVAKKIESMGGKIHLNSEVINIKADENSKIEYIKVKNNNKETETVKGDFFFSSMPVKNLIEGFENDIDEDIKNISSGLQYRDFRTAGLLVKKLKIKNATKIATVNGIIPDTWIYIQEKNVKLGRLQIFNNWSPYMVNAFQEHVWIGLEYFCNEGDEIWSMDDKSFIDFASKELASINIVEKNDIIDGCSVKVKKAYPAYFGTYKDFERVKKYLNKFENLFLIGRNGQHKYNNMDHSMMTAMTAVENIINEKTGKDNIWEVNTETSYHESKQ
ncbi:MAG: NAD(P)/FAD-dependent oxidoreductase [Endomicrobium sp.]|jgi:protoporphyrinogen oxidase|nr:NAD(P)/FAD-dependent oxidoreductase [Endomicrobium sp.]